MAYKGNHYTVASSVHFNEAIKDFLVACGWTLEGPSTNLTTRQAQDDDHAHILGWFLKSTGEDGQQDIHIHLGLQRGYKASRNPMADFAYLVGDHLNVGATSFALDDVSKFSNNGYFKLGNEVIKIGTVNVGGGTLDGCTRGIGGTTPEAHYDDDVAVELAWGNQEANDETCARPCIELFAFRDLANPIASSSSASDIGQVTSGVIAGLTGYEEDKFNYHSLVKVSSGAEDGKMRWCTNSTGGGVFTHQPFISNPGTVDVDIISGGFLSPCSRRCETSGGASEMMLGTVYNVPGAMETPMNMWIYGSKDGFIVVTLRGSTYLAFYYGNYIPFSSPITTNTNAGASAGAYSIFVDDPYQFVEGGVYRLISQDVSDWATNQSQSGSTFMGATGSGEWDDLDPEEIPTELVKVAPGGINIGTGEITLVDPLIYAYSSGAVIGEDPRPICRYTCGDSNNTSVLQQFGVVTTPGGRPTDLSTITAFRAVPYERCHTDCPTHRQHSRCFTDDGTPWAEVTNYNESYMNCGAVTRLWPMNLTDIMEYNKNRVNQQLSLLPFGIEYSYISGGDDIVYGETYNCWNRAYGVIPFIRFMENSLGSAQEDTVKAPWAGKYETFRVISLSGTGWCALGPEIWS